MRVKLMAAAAGLAMLAGCEDANVNRVIDGERLVVGGSKLRIFEIDAPSIADPKCEAERAAAELTIERLEGLMLGARELTYEAAGSACLPLMTCDARVTADGLDVGAMLIAEGLAVHSTSAGAKLDAHDWCAAPLTPEEPAVSGPSAAESNVEGGLQSAPETTGEADAADPVVTEPDAPSP